MSLFKKNKPFKLKNNSEIPEANKGSLLQSELSAPTRLYEILSIILLVVTILWLAALVTHSTSDDIWLQTNENIKVENIVGKFGARLAEFSFAWFGYASYLIPSILLLVSVFSFKQHKQIRQITYGRFISQGIGIILMLFLLSGFMTNNANSSSGGWIGVIINQPLVNIFGQLVDIVYIGLMMIALSLSSYWSWFIVFDKTGRIIAKLFDNLKKYLSHKYLLRQQKKQLQSVKKERDSLIKAQKQHKHKQPIIQEAVTEVKPSKQADGQQASLFTSPEQLPTLSLLDPMPVQTTGYSQEVLNRMSAQVEMKLKDFGFDVSIETVTPGPIITQFELSLAPGVKVAQIMNLSKDLARALLVESVRIVDVIPGKPVIGLEIPNAKRELISLKQILSSETFDKAKSPLTVTLGKDINGNPIVADLAKMPHLLVAGATGMGKSVGINAMILSILYKSAPQDVRMIMIDPKVVELATYADIPHLLTPVIIDMSEAAGALRWSVNEMERRYQLLAKFGVRNIDGINKKIEQGKKNNEPLTDPFFDINNAMLNTAETGEQKASLLEHFPLIVIIIDEYADMLGALAQEDRNKAKRVEVLIIRLAQKARAAGIHLVIATQRPSVDVITGLIKSNIPTRIAFRVSSKIDSRTILDQGGAEQLLGMGDMLYMTTSQTQIQRIHGAFVSDDEVNRITDSLRKQGKPDYIQEIIQTANDEDGVDGLSKSNTSNSGEQDPMYDEAVAVVLQTQRASISSVQRRLRIGYNRAARIIEDMEVAGIVSPMNSNGNREILVSNNNE